MSKTAKIITTVSVSVVVVLAVVLGCLFGIKCSVNLDYGYNAPLQTGSDGYITEGGAYVPSTPKSYNPKSITVTRFTKYAPDRPTRSGYTFEGWYTDSACTIPWNNTAVNGDMTLYAKWKAV